MKKIFFLISVFVAGHFLHGQTVSKKLETFVTTFAAQSNFNGTILVAQKGNVLVEKAFGFKDVARDEPNTVNSIYQVGSVTKQFTSTVILQLQEQHKLSVKDKLSKYFPDFPNGNKITLENLLTHTSGIYNYTNDSTFMADEITKHYARDRMMALFKNKPLDFEPGTKWSYSNSGM